MPAMGDWGIALIAACSAIAGSIVTGWYGRTAADEQARAARHAGDRQADAMLETVRLTLHEQANERMLEVRRQAYVRFLDASETVVAEERGGHGQQSGARAALQRALASVSLEGPDEVTSTANTLADLLRRHARSPETEQAKLDFIMAARVALRD